MDMDFHSKLSRAKGHNERAKIRAEQKASDEAPNKGYMKMRKKALSAKSKALRA